MIGCYSILSVTSDHHNLCHRTELCDLKWKMICEMIIVPELGSTNQCNALRFAKSALITMYYAPGMPYDRSAAKT